MLLLDKPRSQSLYDREDLAGMFLPQGQMLQLDRVSEIRDERLAGEMDVAGHWVFPMHFPGDPIFPGTLLIEAAGQAVAVWSWHAGFRGRPRLGRVTAKFESPVLPGDETVTFVAAVRQKRFVFAGSVDVYVQERRIAQTDLVLMVV